MQNNVYKLPVRIFLFGQLGRETGHGRLTRHGMLTHKAPEKHQTFSFREFQDNEQTSLTEAGQGQFLQA